MLNQLLRKKAMSNMAAVEFYLQDELGFLMKVTKVVGGRLYLCRRSL